MPGTNKRYATRAATKDAMATVWSDSRELRCLVLNVSTGGMALLTEPGQALARFIRLRANLGEGWPNIDLDAIVLRRERREEGTLWGVEFHQAPPHIVTQIEAFVRLHAQREAGGMTVAGKPQAEGTAQRRPANKKFTPDSHLDALYDAAVRSVGV